jgi:THO complex subunit 7
MAAICTEHETQNRTIQGQKSALDGIISDLGLLRFMGKDRDIAASLVASPRMSPAPDDNVDVVDGTVTSGTGQAGQAEEKEEGEEDRGSSESAPGLLTSEKLVKDDIEMGEVEEDPKNAKGKKKMREELEEGEASDSSSALSDPPDD